MGMLSSWEIEIMGNARRDTEINEEEWVMCMYSCVQEFSFEIIPYYRF